MGSVIDLPTEADPVRLIQGDCLDVMDSLPDEGVYVITDPPYGIALASHGTRFRGMRPIAGDDTTDLGQRVIDECRSRGWPVLAFANPDKPWTGKWRNRLVWNKGEAVGIGGDRATCWKFTWELILCGNFPAVYGKREGAVLNHPVTSKDYDRHPAAKPLSLMRYLIRKLVPSDGLVFDPFAGSGSTLVAALMEGRRAVGVEIDPTHFATARKRIDHALGTGAGSLFAGADL